MKVINVLQVATGIYDFGKVVKLWGINTTLGNTDGEYAMVRFPNEVGQRIYRHFHSLNADIISARTKEVFFPRPLEVFSLYLEHNVAAGGVYFMFFYED